MSSSSSGKVRHLSFLASDLAEPFSKFEGLRTIYFPIRGVGPCSESFLYKCVSRFKCLRVLDLSDSTFNILPRSIGKMKHLRYLDISRNLRIRRRPDTICRLQNLQFLSLRECVEIEELPSDMRNLINLRYLDITTKQHFLPEEEIESLRSLRHLYFCECPNLSSLSRMQQITNIRTIGIDSCRNLKSLPLDVSLLTSLRSLLISYCENLYLSGREGEKISYKWPSLQTLALAGLPTLVKLPSWLYGSANTLKTIKIDDCPNFDALPAWFAELSSLEKLYINKCPNLYTLRGIRYVTSLQVLGVGDCPELIQSRNRCFLARDSSCFTG
ncbi:NBS-LRR disease resistance protein [Quillaja saponaria]|uniref:NBS-LRR disease resistance protein n=1 Tax=Quillaja saponaria TaxID=32244 RepID=A0AAD7Q8D5_QUISA|nr:NBS-LRR disease resistance protein [Quillaja saponaria]